MNLRIIATLFLTFVVSMCLKTTEKRLSGKLIEEKKPSVSEYSGPTGIVGGKTVPITKAKYICSLIVSGNFIGSGIIINKHWILTAAFNVKFEEPRDTKIRVGSSFFNKGGKLYDAHEFIIHPNYTGNWDFDIALVKLNKSLTFTGNVHSLEIATSLPQNGTYTKIYGFGSTNNLTNSDLTPTKYFGGFLQSRLLDHRLEIDLNFGKYVENLLNGNLISASVPFIDYETCSNIYNESDFTQHSFCASKKGVGACSYDWGSPLVYKKKLLGIFSGTYECGSTKYPGVYIDVTKFRHWIENTLKRHGDLLHLEKETNYEIEDEDENNIVNIFNMNF